MEIIFTKDQNRLQQWDEFVVQQHVSNHLLLSTWNASFSSYGFDFEIALMIENNVIIGGFAAVIAKVAFLKFYIVPFGPITKEDKTNHLNELIAKVLERAKELRCCYTHIALPIATVANPHIYSKMELPILKTAEENHRFKYVYSAFGINWKSTQDFETEEQLIQSFRTSVRRNIRNTLRKGLEIRHLTEESDVKMGYDLCLENATSQGYALRSWNDFNTTILNLIQKKQAVFLGAFLKNELKGALFIIKAGNHYTNILGGTKKEKPDLLAGHFLHYQAMCLAIREKVSGYNISLGGSEGAMRLKSSYADTQIYFEKGKYHWVLRPTYFKIFLFFEVYLKRYKKPISQLLSRLK